MDLFEKLKEECKGDAKKSEHIKLFESYANKGRDAYRESIAVCGYCGLKQCDAPDIPFHIDHIVPRALGGSEDPENLVDACQPCNYLKRDQRGWVTLDERVGKSHIMDYVNGKWRMKNLL